jgi:predicted transcriptional regulator
MSTVKEEARKLIEELPDQATWVDIMYEVYVRTKVEAGLKAAECGDIVAHDEVRQKFLRE